MGSCFTVINTFTFVPTALSPAPTEASQGIGGSALIAFVKDGDILVWEEATCQSQTIFDSGDVIRVELSDDGQLVAFLRRSFFAAGGYDQNEQSALWVIERSGENPRELVSAEQLRALLNASETDSTNFPRLRWIPNTHRLLYSGNTYDAHGYGEGVHTPTRGVYVVDANSLANTELAPADSSPAFEPSPDGQQVALLTPTGLSFVDVDSSHLRQDVLIYSPVGRPGRVIPTGVWSQDARAFVIVAPIESESEGVLNFTIWRVPVDGSPARELATLPDTGPYVTFAPDGSVAAFSRWAPAGSQGEPVSGTFIIPLAEDLGPLAGPAITDIYGPSMWSPGGSAYVLDGPDLQDLFQLCPNASQLVEICGPPIHFAEPIAYLEWIDGSHFLYVTREPKWLYLGALDGSATAIVEEPQSFAAVAATCVGDSEFVSDVTIPDGTPFSPNALFRKTWRMRNAGTCAWDASYRLTFLTGDRMSGPHSAPLGDAVQPGEEVDLSVTLIAPEMAGTYQGQWQLFAPDGTPFGARPYVVIQVP